MHDSLSSAPIVLVAPAMAIGSGYYRPLVEEFRARGWEARALTRRGFERDGVRASRRNDWAYRDEIDDLARAVAQARTEVPGRPVIALGHSLGGQIAAGHDVLHEPLDGIVHIGAAIPHFRHYPKAGLPILTMARVIVPVTAATLGYVPKPAFGGPGARTLMREWSKMIVSGRPPYETTGSVKTPALVISLEGDDLAPAAGVDQLADAVYAPEAVTRWHRLLTEVPEGASNDHITWVRTPATVVDRVLSWWGSLPYGARTRT